MTALDGHYDAKASKYKSIELTQRPAGSSHSPLNVGVTIGEALLRSSLCALPVGMVAPMVHFNFNFQRTKDPVYKTLLFFASIVGYALTGWLTSMALVICFNLAARLKGGIDADFIFFPDNGHLEGAKPVEENSVG